MERVFLREYDTKERADNDKLLLRSADNLPYTLAYPVSRFSKQMATQNYGRAMNYALDFFEISVQYISCVLLALIQEKGVETVADKKKIFKITEKIDIKRPLSFGDWAAEILVPLVSVSTSVLPDNELVKALSCYVVNDKFNPLFGNEKHPGVVKIRNDYRGHTTTLSEEIYRGVIYTIEPYILLMLRAIEPVQKWETFSGDASGRVLAHKGCHETEPVLSQPGLEKYHYYIRPDSAAELIDMFPLIFCNNKGYVYVFQTLKKEAVAYTSSNENALTFFDDCWNDSFDSRMQQLNPSFDIAKELNWEELRELMQRETSHFLDRAYKDKKYNQELFVDRKQLSTLFDEFIQSNKTLFPLLGDAGQGKTNQLCYWAEQFSDSHNGVLILGGADFSALTLEAKIRNIFSVRGKDIHKFIDGVHSRAKEKNHHIYILFDAINECLTYPSVSDTQGPVALFEAISNLFGQSRYTQFKVLLTCRTYTWKTLFQHRIADISDNLFGIDSEDEAAVRGFTDDEVRQAYQIYGHLYQMGTDYDQLTRSAIIRLKDPLMLKIACTNFLGLKMPDTTTSYTSITLFEEMMTKISNSYAGKNQHLIIKGLAKYILNRYEANAPTDHISTKTLRDAYVDSNSPLHHFANLIYKKDGSTVAYNELLNKPERPILRLVESAGRADSEQIQFIYERFLEFAMAMVFVEREVELLKDKNENIPPVVFVNQLHKASTNVVFMGAMRNALIMDFRRTKSFSSIITLARDYGDNNDVSLLVNEVFNVLIRENYEDLLWRLTKQLLTEQIPQGVAVTQEFNLVSKKIANSEADDRVIARHRELNSQLRPIIRLRKLALVSTLNGIFLSDYFNEDLYEHDPFGLLWQLMNDPISEIANDSCLYAYYLSNKKHTLEYSPLKENLSERIAAEMYMVIKNNRLLKLYLDKTTRNNSIVFLETATRIITLLIIDTLLSGKDDSQQRAAALLNEFKSVIKHITVNYKVIKAIMPVFHIILRKQLTFQSAYVNNTVEYQTFWDDTVVPETSEDNSWDREALRSVVEYVHHFNKVQKGLTDAISTDFQAQHDKILSAYLIGDSFSFLITERILVIMGVSHWDNIAPIVNRFFTDEYRRGEWFDYAHMSMLYVLFQVQVHSPSHNDELLKVFERESEDWTMRNRGLFKGRNSHKANTTGLYKRNLMNWYCVVYCTHIGDAAVHPGDERCVPLFYKLIDRAIADNDKELLFHLIENISELISDFGYIRTALDLLQYTMIKLDSKEIVDTINNINVERDGIYSQDVIWVIGNVLSTAKHYFPSQINTFIKRDIVGLPFPGVPKYREEILNYNPSGETLSDLFTHKFGNFLMWTLLNMEVVDDFACESVKASSKTNNSIAWFDQVIRILFRQMFDVKL